jgi:hypothetical protein
VPLPLFVINIFGARRGISVFSFPLRFLLEKGGGFCKATQPRVSRVEREREREREKRRACDSSCVRRSDIKREEREREEKKRAFSNAAVGSLFQGSAPPLL